MKRIIKKVASIFVATAMVAAFGVSAMATDLSTDGTVGDKNPANKLDRTLVIKKELVAYNPESMEIYAPDVTYSYAVEGVTVDAVITDSDGVKATVKAGVGTPTVDDVVWEHTDKINASSAGESNEQTTTINFEGITFTGAGVYRYKITETKNGDAVTGGTTSDIRYLDVYVRDTRTDDNDDTNAYQIYGYVLFENNNSIDATSTTTNTVTDAVKTEGFVANGSDTADCYYTYNLTVTKNLVNDNGNINNEFPFELQFSPAVTGTYNLVASYTTDPVELGTVNRSIKSGSANAATYYGIPCGTTVKVSEKNNVPTAAYSVTTESDDTTNDTNITSAVIINYNETTDPDQVVLTNAAGASGVIAKSVTFTNTLALISPTGVALAVLPFVILFTFGVGFLVAGTAKRKEDQE